MSKIFLIMILVFCVSSVLAEGITGAATVNVIVNDGSSQVATQNNFGLGVSILILAIILGLTYWLVRKNKRSKKI